MLRNKIKEVLKALRDKLAITIDAIESDKLQSEITSLELKLDISLLRIKRIIGIGVGIATLVSTVIGIVIAVM